MDGRGELNTNEIVLTYVGTILIAMEFVRKFSNLQALTGMIIGWPVLSFFGEKGLQNWAEVFNAHKLSSTFRILFSFILSIVTLPLTVAFYVIWFVVLILNSFHNWINRLYFEGKRRYRPFYMILIGLSLFAHRMAEYQKYADIDEQKVMQHIEETEIPILPIIGVILITIAFILILL